MFERFSLRNLGNTFLLQKVDFDMRGSSFPELRVQILHGTNYPLRVWTDSTEAVGISTCLGKLRHFDAHTRWVQQAVYEACGPAGDRWARVRVWNGWF